MFDQEELVRAVDLQRRSFELLQSVASGIQKGFISFDTAHSHSSISAIAEVWVERHYLNIPQDARPSRDDLKDFCGLFSTYLENSFELVRNPGKRLYSPRAHCFCPLCSWLVDVPNLKTKTPTSADKKRARKMMLDVVKHLGTDNNVSLSTQAAEAIVDDPNLREYAALCAYAADLPHLSASVGRLKR